MQRQPNFLFFALRDSAILLATALLWFLFAESSLQRGPLGDFTGVMIGASLALCAHLLHEWGHLLGGLAGRSAMTPGASFSALSLFIYDTQVNSAAQFLLMSFSGFAFTVFAVWFGFVVLPDGYLATHIARGYVILQVLLAVVLELPLVLWALIGKNLPPLDYRPQLGSLVPRALLLKNGDKP